MRRQPCRKETDTASIVIPDPPHSIARGEGVADTARGAGRHSRGARVPGGVTLRSRCTIDLVLVAVVVVATFALTAHFNLAESLRSLTAPYEYLQLDELPVVMLVAVSGLAWFAWRRHREARRELWQRQAVESRLAEALGEKSRLARRFIDAQEAERRSLARELHDELAQWLNAIKLDAVAIAGHDARSPEHDRARAIVDSVDRIQRVVQVMIRRFRPVALDELGLSAALEHSIGEWQRRMRGTALRLRTTGDLDTCGEAVNLAVYRMVQEGLTNISRHARATRVHVRLDRKAAAFDGADGVVLAIDDDGVGADLGWPRDGLGLVGMRERAELLGGEFLARSTPGQGFSLRVRLPLAAGEASP